MMAFCHIWKTFSFAQNLNLKYSLPKHLHKNMHMSGMWIWNSRQVDKKMWFKMLKRPTRRAHLAAALANETNLRHIPVLLSKTNCVLDLPLVYLFLFATSTPCFTLSCSKALRLRWKNVNQGNLRGAVSRIQVQNPPLCPFPATGQPFILINKGKSGIKPMEVPCDSC